MRGLGKRGRGGERGSRGAGEVRGQGRQGEIIEQVSPIYLISSLYPLPLLLFFDSLLPLRRHKFAFWFWRFLIHLPFLPE